MDYPFELLDPERFQQFCQSLLVREHKETLCFPVGQPDGGRDAVVPYLPHGRKFAVYQVKFVRNPQALSDIRKWSVDIISSEAAKVKALIPKGAQSYFLLTNVTGTAHLDVGSIDKLQKVLSEIVDIPVVCWWRDDLNRRLDSAWDLKWVYPELMTGPDLIRGIIELGLKEEQNRRSAAIRAFVRDQYTADKEVRFRQIELQNNLLDLFIDVPVIPRSPSGSKKQRYEFWNTWHALLQDRGADEIMDYPSGFVANPDVPFRRDDQSVGTATMLLHSRVQKSIRVLFSKVPPDRESPLLLSMYARFIVCES